VGKKYLERKMYWPRREKSLKDNTGSKRNGYLEVFLCK
jgi:hypothetical protein